MAHLSRPSVLYKNSYLAAARELVEDSQYPDTMIEQTELHFTEYVEDLLSRADKANTAPGMVPESIWWLMEDNEYIGTVSVRHKLTPRLLETRGHIGYGIRPSQRRRGYGRLILELALEKAGELGLDRVLVTCDPMNTPSRRIIEHNDGKLDDKIGTEIDSHPGGVLRYWIDLRTQPLTAG